MERAAQATSTPPVESTDEGPRRPNRGRNKNQRNRNYQQANEKKIIGKTAELKENVFQAGPPSADRFNTIVRNIAEHIARTVPNGGEFLTSLSLDSIDGMKFKNIEEPQDPDDETKLTSMKKWEIAIQKAEKLKENRNEASRAAFSIIIGQCTKELRDRMETFKEWPDIQQKCDVIALLELI